MNRRTSPLAYIVEPISEGLIVFDERVGRATSKLDETDHVEVELKGSDQVVLTIAASRTKAGAVKRRTGLQYEARKTDRATAILTFETDPDGAREVGFILAEVFEFD